MIDVCPVGALTDKTFRFKNRVWFTNPVDAHCECNNCAGKVRLWLRGDEILRVTGRKDVYGEVVDFICNDCRFQKKKKSDWVIEGPAKINSHSVISQNHYESLRSIRFQNKLDQIALTGSKSGLGEGALDPNNI
jgi:NADH-quinone oxidoreductase subunit G